MKAQQNKGPKGDAPSRPIGYSGIPSDNRWDTRQSPGVYRCCPLASFGFLWVDRPRRLSKASLQHDNTTACQPTTIGRQTSATLMRPRPRKRNRSGSRFNEAAAERRGIQPARKSRKQQGYHTPTASAALKQVPDGALASMEYAFRDSITHVETISCQVSRAAALFSITGALVALRRAVSEQDGGRSTPGAQTMIGSRATASKRLPRLSIRGDSLSADPRSRITTWSSP